MKGIKIIACGLVLYGCAREPSISENITENAINTTTALEQSLSKECKTESIITQITVIKSEIRSISKACEIEKDQITKDMIRWKFSFWALVSIIVAYIIKKVLK